ncbi:MAG: hypothetical protein WD342_14170 [Verrucomicrobiales bacterium]
MKEETNAAGFSAHRLAIVLCAIGGAAFLSSCTTASPPGRGSAGQLSAAALNSPAVKARNERIAMEPTGNYYIGRRWWTDGTRFWGYLRKPRQPWSEAKLVIMNESIVKQPDRVPEEGGSASHGYDHNFEYRIWGSFTGDTVYDPNSNFVVPEFRLSKFELLDRNPGFVFYPGESYNPRRLPPKHPPFPG